MALADLLVDSAGSGATRIHCEGDGALPGLKNDRVNLARQPSLVIFPGPPHDVDNWLKLLEYDNGMSKVITPHFERLIDRFVASGRFNNKSEVIRAGLRLLEEHETESATAGRDDLSRIIQRALADSRPLIPAANLLRRRPRK